MQKFTFISMLLATSIALWAVENNNHTELSFNSFNAALIYRY